MAYHEHWAGEPWEVVVQDTYHEHAPDEPSGFPITLAVEDAYHGQFSEEPGTVYADDAYHSHVSESPKLSPFLAVFFSHIGIYDDAPFPLETRQVLWNRLEAETPFFSSEGQGGINGRLEEDLSFPQLKTTVGASLEEDFPSFLTEFDGSFLYRGEAELKASFPKLDAHGLTGRLGRLEREFPFFSLLSSGYIVPVGVLDALMPGFFLESYGKTVDELGFGILWFSKEGIVGFMKEETSVFELEATG